MGSGPCFGSRRLVSSTAMSLHHKCRGGLYPGSQATRADVPDDKVPWTVSWPEYQPTKYTSDVLNGKPWADPELGSDGFAPAWNQLDGKVDRRSHTGQYSVCATTGAPLNPGGRTGISGRGLLGRWGPNHAADPLVTRWRRGADGEPERHAASGRPILQLVTIQRRDCHAWALPGGMVDPGERVSATVAREFQEEALNSLAADERQRARLQETVAELFAGGEKVFAGYVDDPRNTDNAWMESVAVSFHDASGSAVGAFPLQAGDDARAVRWVDVSGDLNLYANHSVMVRRVVDKLGAHW